MTALPRERVSSQIIKEDKPSLVRRFITVGHFKTLHVSVLRLLVKKDELSTEVVRIWYMYVSIFTDMVFPFPVVPEAPADVKLVTKGSKTVDISWMAGFKRNSTIQNYTVEIGIDKENFSDVGCQGTLSNGSCVLSNSSTSASLTGLFPFTKYFIRVFATNAVGSSKSSSVVNVTTDEEGTFRFIVSLLVMTQTK